MKVKHLMILILIALTAIGGAVAFVRHQNARGLENEIRTVMRQSNESKNPLATNRTLFAPAGYRYVNTVGDIMVYVDESSITSIKLNPDVLEKEGLKDFPMVFDVLYISPREKDFSYLFMTEIVGMNQNGRCKHKELKKISRVGDYKHAKEITRSESKFSESDWQLDSRSSAIQKCFDHAVLYAATNKDVKVSYLLPD